MVYFTSLSGFYYRKGYWGGNGFRGLMTYMVNGTLRGVNAGYFGLGDSWGTSWSSNKHNTSYVFLESLLPEFLVYLVLIVLSIVAAFFIRGGGRWPHLAWVLRFYWVIGFGFTFLIRGSLIWRVFFSGGNNDGVIYFSFVVAIITMICVLAEFVYLLYQAFVVMKISFSKGGDYGARKIVPDVLYWTVVLEAKNAFMNGGLADKNCVSRCYNFLWIWRWIVIWLLFTVIWGEGRTVNFITFLIQVGWLIFTIIAVVSKNVFQDKTVGVCMIIQEFAIVIVYLMALIFMVDNHAHHKFPPIFIYVIAIVMFIFWVAAIILEFVILVLGFMASTGNMSGGSSNRRVVGTGHTTTTTVTTSRTEVHTTRK